MQLDEVYSPKKKSVKQINVFCWRDAFAVVQFNVVRAPRNMRRYFAELRSSISETQRDS